MREFMIQPGEPFVAFSPSHLITIGLIIGLAALLPALVLHTPLGRWSRVLEWFLAGTLVVNELLKIGSWVWLYNYPLRLMLPLHLCSIAVVLTAWLLVRRRGQYIFEIVYFWGLGGTFIALFTPDIPYAFPHVFYLYFFISHGLIVIGVIYSAFVFHLRPWLVSVRRVFLFTVAYAAVIMPFNFLIDANYLFLRHKPGVSSVFDYLGPWPWYIGALGVLAPVLFFLCYCPYLVSDWLRSPPKDDEASSSVSAP